MKLKVIIGSTSPVRKEPIIADWFLKIAKQHPDFEVELLDLKEINLPFFGRSGTPEDTKVCQRLYQKLE